MHTFRVVKEPLGWAVRVGDGMSTPFWSRDLAVREANCLCDALRRHGQTAQVVIEEPEFQAPPEVAARLSLDRLSILLRSLQGSR